MSPVNGKKKPVLITGGAGFIGTNLAKRLLGSGTPVLIFDNLSRPGVERNLKWLQSTFGGVEAVIADICCHERLRQAVERASQVFHFAAQVAVTTSITNPIQDFNANACGTVSLLEVLRTIADPPPLIFTSTNKVYGGMEDIELSIEGGRYQPKDRALSSYGISEEYPLDFNSPYGCSKGAADQYVMDYARTFGIKAAVFRMSCIYGPHQMGAEDQGWVAHFLMRAVGGNPVTVYGDGRQVRDVLFIDDLVEAFLLAQKNIDNISGQAFNIGGGPENTLSLLELLDIIAGLTGEGPAVSFDSWRPADQRYYVSDSGKFRRATGWVPRVGAAEGVRRLYEWLLAEERALKESREKDGQEVYP